MIGILHIVQKKHDQKFSPMDTYREKMVILIKSTMFKTAELLQESKNKSHDLKSFVTFLQKWDKGFSRYDTWNLLIVNNSHIYLLVCTDYVKEFPS